MTMSTSERVAELLAAIDALDADERAEFDAASRPADDAPPDYDTPIVLDEPVDLGSGKAPLAEIHCVNRPRMAHFVLMTKERQRGTDDGTMMLRVATQLTGIPAGTLEKLAARDAGRLLARLAEWLSPFGDSMLG